MGYRWLLCGMKHKKRKKNKKLQSDDLSISEAEKNEFGNQNIFFTSNDNRVINKTCNINNSNIENINVSSDVNCDQSANNGGNSSSEKGELKERKKKGSNVETVSLKATENHPLKKEDCDNESEFENDKNEFAHHTQATSDKKTLKNQTKPKKKNRRKKSKEVNEEIEMTPLSSEHVIETAS